MLLSGAAALESLAQKTAHPQAWHPRRRCAISCGPLDSNYRGVCAAQNKSYRSAIRNGGQPTENPTAFNGTA
eukprot:3333568-Pyramimonas_sp.AAC.1